VSKDVFDKAMVTTVDEAVASAARIGYPVMLKASEGGGGKGIRMSANEDELRSNFVQVQNEVPGSPMFMMQLCTEARHLEVQIIGDEHGQAVALNGRDCSTQRRFQKIFEEGPPTIAKPDTFREMEKAAMRLTQSIGYYGAGTVEYLYKASTDDFYFLELNPRLQVDTCVCDVHKGFCIQGR
jgi:acetyl-CoA carboxylase/biotin carboxylase 1